MLGHFKFYLNCVLSLLIATPGYSADTNGTKPIAIEVATKNQRSSEDIVKDLIEKWNSAKNLKDLVKLLKVSDKEVALIEKMKVSFKLKKQNLPKAEFNEETSIISIDKQRMQILSYNPLVLSIDGKALMLDQTKIEDQIDYLIKEFASSSKKSVLYDILLPKSEAGSFFGDNKVVLIILGGLLTISLGVMAWNSYQKDEAIERRKVNEALPKYKSIVQEINSQQTRVSDIRCNLSGGYLRSLSVFSATGEIYDYLYDDTSSANDPKQLTVTSRVAATGKSVVCKFVVEDAVWKRYKNVPETCLLPEAVGTNPYIAPAFVPQDGARECCMDRSGKCERWIRNDLSRNQAVGATGGLTGDDSAN